MAHIIADRVKETTETTGTGQLTLLGATTGTRTFNSQMANGDTCYYCIDGGSTGQWEVGLGTYADTDLLTRTTIYSNSNGDTAAVNFSAGVKGVFITNPAQAMSTVPTPTSGTFTPRVDGTSTTGTGTYTAQTGSYIKLGNVCFFSLTITLSAHTGTGGMAIPNLPFTAAAGSQVCSIAVSNLTFSGSPIGVIGGSQLNVYQQVSNTGITYISMDTACTIWASGSYITA